MASHHGQIRSAPTLRSVRWRHMPWSIVLGYGTVVSVLCLIIASGLIWRLISMPAGQRPAWLIFATYALLATGFAAFFVGGYLRRYRFHRRFHRVLLCPRCHYTIEPVVPVRDPGREVQCPECGLRMTVRAYREAFLPR